MQALFAILFAGVTATVLYALSPSRSEINKQKAESKSHVVDLEDNVPALGNTEPDKTQSKPSCFVRLLNWLPSIPVAQVQVGYSAGYIA